MTEKPALDDVLLSMQKALREHAERSIRLAKALAVYTGNQAGADKLAAEMTKVLEAYTGEGINPNIAPMPIFSYEGKNLREAILIDLLVFGEGRTIKAIQEHLDSLGFVKKREGQVRSSVNATANRRYFNVNQSDETVTLTDNGRAAAEKAKRRYGLG